MTKASLILAILALVFLVLAIFTQLPLWISVLCLCVAFLIRDAGAVMK